MVNVQTTTYALSTLPRYIKRPEGKKAYSFENINKTTGKKGKQKQGKSTDLST